MAISIFSGIIAILSLSSTISFNKKEMPTPLAISPLMVSKWSEAMPIL